MVTSSLRRPVRVRSGHRLRQQVEPLTVADAVGCLLMFRHHRVDTHWSVDRQRYGDHVKFTRKSTRSDITDVVRVPHSIELLLDGRYKISHTWVGEPQKRWAAWFRQEFIGHYDTDLEAAQALRDYRTDMQGFADGERTSQ